MDMETGVWVAGALGAAAVLAASRGRAGGARLEPALAAQLAKRPETFILDVRMPDEFAEGHLERAVLIPVQELEARAAELPADKGAPILVYCAAGGRSASAARKLGKLGYSNVRDVPGGIIAWEAQGLPVAR